jgi:hypothetical protein
MARPATKPRSKTKQRPSAVTRRGRRPTFYERNRTTIWLTVLAAGGIAIFALTRGGGGEANTTTAFTGSDFHSMVVDPQDPKRIFAGGHQAVSVSENGGKSWRQISSLNDRDAMGWGFDGSTLYVSGHPGLSVSTDGGKTFNLRNDQLPSTDVHAFGAGKGILYGASPQVGFFASTDAGMSWTVINSTRGRSFFGRILVDSNDPEHLIAADAAGGVSESYDGGREFEDIGGVRSPTWVSWDPNNPQTIVASSQGGAARSEDGGKTWRRLSTPPNATILELDPSNPGRIYAGSHDGSRVVVQVSDDGGETWQRA